MSLREHLRRLHYRELERQEREAYERIPEDPAEFAVWDKVAAWPSSVRSSCSRATRWSIAWPASPSHP